MLARQASRSLGDQTHRHREQGGIAVASASEGTRIDDQVGQRVEVADRVDVAHFWPLDAQLFGLTVDTFRAGALVIDGVIDGPSRSKVTRICPPSSEPEILDTTFAFAKLRVVTRFSCDVGKEEGTAEALRTVAASKACRTLWDNVCCCSRNQRAVGTVLPTSKP